MARGFARPQQQGREYSNADQRDDRLALPWSTLTLLDKVDISERHPGLQLDKLSPVGVGDMKDQKSALEKVVCSQCDGQLFADLLARRDDTLKLLNAQRLPMTTRGSLTLHLSRSGSLENAGIALHPVYGFVYLPGSGIKGLARAYAETVWAPSQPDQKEARWQIEEAFGWSRRKDSSVGRFVFHDAWPLGWPKLIVDVVNNHHPNYYAGGDDPGDWEDPRPVYFLAIDAGNQFEFAISDRVRAANDNLLETACGWLRDALIIEGAGAKTAAGYGRFKLVEGEQAPIPKTLTNATYELRLASPAFLAGADQQQEDCDLRPATLRGLLRWWWRTMHAGHLDRDSLRRLETAMWGDAESGSPVRIAVDFIAGEESQQHPDKRDRQFQQEHGLPRPQSGQKVTQGLFYASYGMAEGNDRNRRRWFRPAKSCWRVTLTVRCGRFTTGSGESVRLSSDHLLEQAAAALWLLTQFGGVGSRSRKGFGSFDDIEVEGIGSKEDCIASAKRLRELCKLDRQQGTPVKALALEEALLLEQVTAWRDPWYALDQTGMVLQLFTKSLDAEKRVALGLPRRVGRGRDARNLRGDSGIDRHAAPALWSLATRQDETLVVRLIAFPAARLPKKADSKAILQELVDFAIQELKRRGEQPPRPSGRGGDRSTHTRCPDRQGGRPQAGGHGHRGHCEPGLAPRPERPPQPIQRPKPAPKPSPCKGPQPGDRVNVEIVANDNSQVTVKVLDGQGEVVRFRQGYYPGRPGEKRKMKVRKVDAQGKITQVAP